MPQITVLDGVDRLVTNQANCLVQNLGPGALYLDDSSASVSGSVRVGVGQSVGIGSTINTHGIANGGDCDVRILLKSNGIYGG